EDEATGAQLRKRDGKRFRILRLLSVEKDRVEPGLAAGQRLQAVARGLETAAVEQAGLGEPCAGTVQVLAVEVGERHRASRLEHAREPERRVSESAAYLEDPPRFGHQRVLREQGSHRLADDGKPVALVGVPAHLGLHRIGRSGETRQVVVDQRIDDVHVALHPGSNVAQMGKMARFLYRFCCGGLVGAQLFFAAVAAQVVFPRDVAALPRDHPRRQLAADLVGSMLARLDAATLALTAVAVVCALVLSRPRTAIAPLLAGVCAAASALFVTPSIQAMREAGTTASGRFAALHGGSSALLVLDMIRLAVAGCLR